MRLRRNSAKFYSKCFTNICFLWAQKFPVCIYFLSVCIGDLTSWLESLQFPFVGNPYLIADAGDGNVRHYLRLNPCVAVARRFPRLLFWTARKITGIRFRMRQGEINQGRTGSQLDFRATRMFGWMKVWVRRQFCIPYYVSSIGSVDETFKGKARPDQKANLQSSQTLQVRKSSWGLLPWRSSLGSLKVDCILWIGSFGTNVAHSTQVAAVYSGIKGRVRAGSLNSSRRPPHCRNSGCCGRTKSAKSVRLQIPQFWLNLWMNQLGLHHYLACKNNSCNKRKAAYANDSLCASQQVACSMDLLRRLREESPVPHEEGKVENVTKFSVHKRRHFSGFARDIGIKKRRPQEVPNKLWGSRNYLGDYGDCWGKDCESVATGRHSGKLTRSTGDEPDD